MRVSYDPNARRAEYRSFVVPSSICSATDICASWRVCAWSVVETQLVYWLNEQLSKFGSKKGAWAVVTGSTDGIGKEFALQLGKAGFNVFLVARNDELLKNTAEEIGTYRGRGGTSRWFGLKSYCAEARYHVTAQSHAIDFAKADARQYSELTDVLKQLDIGVLGERHTATSTP